MPYQTLIKGEVVRVHIPFSEGDASDGFGVVEEVKRGKVRLSSVTESLLPSKPGAEVWIQRRFVAPLQLFTLKRGK